MALKTANPVAGGLAAAGLRIGVWDLLWRRVDSLRVRRQRDSVEFSDALDQLKWYDTAHEIDGMSAIADHTRFLAEVLG